MEEYLLYVNIYLNSSEVWWNYNKMSAMVKSEPGCYRFFFFVPYFICQFSINRENEMASSVCVYSQKKMKWPRWHSLNVHASSFVCRRMATGCHPSALQLESVLINFYALSVEQCGKHYPQLK